MIHKNVDRWLFTNNGNVLTSGGAGNLAKGQFAIVSKTEATVNGAKVVSDFSGFPANKTLELRLGKSPVSNTRTSRNNKPYTSIPFTLKDITGIKVSAPSVTEQKFDSVLIGYDGINPDTALTFVEGDNTVLDITLSGSPIGFYVGGGDDMMNPPSYLTKLHFGYPEGEVLTNQEIVEEAVRRAKAETLPRGNNKITDLVQIDVVNSEMLDASGTPYTFSTLRVNDSGDSNAFGDVQAQYPLYTVIQTERTGNITTYSILHPTASALAPYTQTLASIVKGCDDCLAGYDELQAGFVYNITIEDDGADLSTTVDDVPGFVTGTAVFLGQVDGRGSYTVVTDDKLTDAEIATFLAASAVKGTATFYFLGEVGAVCYDDTITSTAWVDGDTCYASNETYTIQLKDDLCDGSRLAELQAAYPDLVIEEGAASGAATRALTLTGTSGTVNINVAGVNYLATFDTDLTTTAANFVTTHAAAILAATGAVVTSALAVITFADDAEGFPAITITNATGNLAGTLGAIDYVVVASEGGCQRVYSTTVVTDIICDECDPIFVQQFSSEAPRAFDFTNWVKVEPTPSETALMGIRITALPFILDGGETLQDEVPFYETSVNISVAGGYIENFLNSEQNYLKNFSIKRLSRRQDRDHLGYWFRKLENQSRTYFDGETRHRDNLFAKAVLGEESVLNNRTQYIHYEISIDDTHKAQGNGGRVDTGINYQIVVEVGRHVALEALLNRVAAKAGVEAVQAFGNIA